MTRDCIHIITKYRALMQLLLIVVLLSVQCSIFHTHAQIVIGGSVYGGGNAGDTGGGTTVTVYEGDLHAVFAGARMANVGGSAFVHLDGEHASNYILADYVYGGNDIAGTIGTSNTLPVDENKQTILTKTAENNIDNTWNAFVRISSKTTTGDELPNDAKIYIGQLFGGGNGYYDYNTTTNETGTIYTVEDKHKTTDKVVATSKTPLTAPELGKTYLEILGGSIVYAYGGGNNATVTDTTVICLDNPSKVVNTIKDTNNPNADNTGELLTNNRFKVKMRINTGFSYPSSGDYQIGRLFGGNNKAKMAIRPVWRLKRGKVRNIYSGGNEGAMTSKTGIHLVLTSPDMEVDNVYGGCRMADVNPDKSTIAEETIEGYTFPANYAARVLVTAGNINNVYGGNDVTGNVYGGNAVGIHSSIKGDVYGGGNGSYPYTDNPELANHNIFGDLYYNPGSSSADALKSFRPNAESVSIRVVGTDANHPTVIGGAIYCGGNSATLHSDDPTKDVAAELKIGSYVIADKVFLGNNGENMKDGDILAHYAKNVDDDGNVVDSGGKEFSSMDLTDKPQFEKYMNAVAMDIKPRVVFDANYAPYSTKFGSFYCGGNVGSMMVNGAETLNFSDKIIIFDKLVGGSNDANIYAQDGLNAEYLGGLLGNPDANGNKLTLNFNGLKIQPMRWKVERDNDYNIVKDANGDVTYIRDTYGNRILEWNTISASTGKDVEPITSLTPDYGESFETSKAADLDRRLKGGNIYGGCYNTGHVNGNVIINLNASLEDRKGNDAIFDQVEQNEGEAILYGNDSYKILERRSGVLLDKQGMDVLGKALNVFGGGYGEESEIWGSTTINLNAGYTFQIFGGGEKGAIGKGVYNSEKGKLEYNYDSKYSCYVNLKGSNEGVYRGHADDKDDMAEAEFIYGGSFEAPIAGNTVINLGHGRIFNSFAGSCNADILGHTETYIGRSGVDANGNDILGFPWIRDHVYGGNDLGGEIKGSVDFTQRIHNDVKDKVHNPKNKEKADVANATAYMEYIQGRVDYIFGGCYGDYDYTDPYFKDYTFTRTPVINDKGEIISYTYTDADSNAGNVGQSKTGFTKPRLNNAFVNFKANTHNRNAVNRIYGAGQGKLKGFGVDSMQNRSYILIEIPQSVTKFQNVEVFGAGANCGLGMGVTPELLVDHKDTNDETVEGQPDNASAIIDLVRGQISATYGGSFEEGVTRRTVTNVPNGSTIQLSRIFGGAYGADPLYPCDVYEAKVNYSSEDARVSKIYGGNNNADRTLYGQVNINSVVWQNKESGYLGTVFGAGCGEGTWSQYTEVNLNDGAKVYEVYGGGQAGKVLNTESLLKWRHDEGAALDLSLPGYEDTSVTYKDKDNADFHLDAGLNSPLVRPASLDGVSKYNTNVHINKGATVVNYAYGGGLGTDAVVSGTTYIDLLGGTVTKDLYAAGTSGAVLDFYKVGAKTNENPNGFTASATAYIEGGSARNVYGGGWEGDVGYHDKTTTATTDDIPGETHVVIGIRQDQASLPEGYGFYKGVPAIQRNAYSGGEGGSVFGTANLTLNNGYIGYIYDTSTNKYEEKIHDETWTDHVGLDRLSDCGNLFGGGYDDNSSVDFTNVTVWGGVVRNSVFGGGEIATIGRGKVKESDTDNKVRELDDVYKFGSTNIEIFNGHIKRNVFGGGKGYNILGYGGTRGFYTDGYVFGSTEVYIHGGEVGTDAGLAEGYGNVFGGGDVGFVYSKGYFSDGTAAKENTGSPNHIYYKDADGNLTEDCKVVIAPMLQIRANGTEVTFNGETYRPYDYVPTDYLNTLPANKNDAGWINLYTGDKLTPDDQTERGIHIHNAVFGGGNVSSNSESYNNATTVFGNTTATLYDVYHHDFITVGTEHTGGLYGGGNLSLVGGYRELNITNYGTDYYGLDQQISLEEYQKLTNRERAYFKLEYLCQQDVTIGGKNYKQNDRISEDEYNALPADYKNTTYWVQYGFCSIYAGRLLNTIQRADFCGVYGSRLVLQGAKDRVADVADATEYTINRIGEVSLNQQRSVIPSDVALKPGVTPKEDPNDYDPEDYEDWQKAIHGNYFGIYSVVNYLGALTSDVHFDDARRYVDKGQTYVDNNTYYHWKEDHLQKRDRNNGTSLNQVALASGVYLELTTENSTPSNKKYGTVTGIIELDLINIKKDIEGGGYVYARNEHGARDYHSEYVNVLLSEYNKQKIVGGKEWRDEARTHKRYTYSESDLKEMQTSGNFIHKSKRIVDDCYPMNGVYSDSKGNYVTSPAHYWYIKGEVYIYDQVVSAYAGSASAYSKEVKIPLTITAGSNGKLKLLNVQPSLYAYYGDYNQTTRMGSDGVKVDNESMTYKLNDVITWWDWHQLAQNEQKYFVKETRVNVDSCVIDGTPYAAGTFVLEDDATIHETTAWQAFQSESHTVTDARGEAVTDLAQLFRSSNNIGHDTGYVLTLNMNSPKDWDDWYSPALQTDVVKIRKDAYENLSSEQAAKYRRGPTYRLTGADGLYGQRAYSVGEIISKETYDDYTSTVGQMSTPPEGQATAEPAYVALEDFGTTQKGNAIGETAYNALSDKTKFAPAMVCINTIQVGDEEYVLMGELVSGNAGDINALAQKYKTYNYSLTNADHVTDAQALEYVQSHLSNAYYISSAGNYGGQYYQNGLNYGAIKSWSTLTDDRNKFDFNYDAFDVLVDPEYHGEGYTETYYKSPYSDVKPVEYVAAYNGTLPYSYEDNSGNSYTISSDAGRTITREAFEEVRNDQLHYTRLSVDAGSDTQKFYIVKETLIDNGVPYAKGQDISEKDYNALSSVNKNKVQPLTFQKGSTAAVHYYCYESYTPNTSFTTESGTAGQEGSIISATVFNEDIPNYQKQFSIQGSEPTETTTLYVSRESNAKDVTSEKVISVVYQYTYYEADDEGEGVSLVNELHVLNIHLQLESGAPEIGPLNTPPAVLPGNSVGLKAPTVNPGLYEVLTSGWELFESEDDAMLHRNGEPFTNNGTPLYWYQNQKVWLAFYSKTYLGKTYSNYVPLTVANYHDLDAVMKDKEHHLYVDHPDVMRNSKIYIDNRTCKSDPDKSELDLLKDFFDLSLQTEIATTGATKDHALLDSHVKGGADLEFILNSDVSPKAYTDWTPIGNADGQCFEGTFHGDGYTISELNNSLFGKLCGSVYNLGVTGSFTSAGVADSGDGYVENCWINTSGTPDGSVKAVFGTTDPSLKQAVNCYYPNTKNYADGEAHPMSETEFYNGTVAYNLNGFYLNKRYHDKKTTSGTAYQYLRDVNGTLSDNLLTGYYPENPEAQYGDVGYVERRYADGDFVYAGGTVPENYDERMRVVTVGTTSTITYSPIWPDDYIYFGQMLTYGHSASQAHQDWPSRINKSSSRLPFDDGSNRVYRAPAYYRSATMDKAHFNIMAYLTAQSAPKTVTDTDLKDAYPNMTAIDFAGHEEGTAAAAYKQGYNGNLFYQPLLDDDGLGSINTNGQTQNLLVYAPLGAANENQPTTVVNKKTYDVLNAYYTTEPPYANYNETSNKYAGVDKYDYNRVASAASEVGTVVGHLVQATLTNDMPTATNDHLLVDKQDFFCPIAYSFNSNSRMWYQRTPDNYVDRQSGWETISLPFEAEVVTTDKKGELTHFYEGQNADGSKNNIGHEYWLREYKGMENGSGNELTGQFGSMAAETGDKTVNNTFLWDYFYEGLHNQQDDNLDKYQVYYKESREYPKYPRMKAGTPYLIGFPGQTYYEFDLSGNFKALTTSSGTPDTLTVSRQMLSFISKTGITVEASDTETGTSADNYLFKTNYLRQSLTGNNWALNAKNNDGKSSFDKTPATATATTPAVNVWPFRPYFTTPTAGAPKHAASRINISSSSNSSFGIDDDTEQEDNVAENLIVKTRRGKIIVISQLRHERDIRIVNVSGVTVAAFTIQPGETVETRVNVAGVYIVNNKKLAVR